MYVQCSPSVNTSELAGRESHRNLVVQQNYVVTFLKDWSLFMVGRGVIKFF